MSTFNFGHRQRMHTQLYGQTSGKELFKVDEYNTRKAVTVYSLTMCIFIFLIEYFFITKIPFKFNFLLILAFIGFSYLGYINFKQQKRLREGLY